MMRDYQPFIVRVDEQREVGFPVRADFQGATWTANIPDALPLLTTQEIEQAKLWLERGFIDRDYAKDFGRRLFQTLFQAAIREGFRIAFDRAAKEGNGLRIVLTLPQALVSLPWELMYDEEGGHGFLARSATAPLVRHYEVTTLPHQRPDKGPLRVLLVTASPEGYPAISGTEETERIKRSLSRRGIGLWQTLRLMGQHLRHSRSLADFFQRVRHRNLYEIDVLAHATKRALQRKIVEAQGDNRGYHVVHFVGHGHVDDHGSYLVFESEENKSELVASDAFAEMLGEPTINLAVLNACQTASAVSLFRSVAQATLQRGVPAVIGMQVPILDRTALGFAEEFYGAWAAGQPIESALSYARRLIKEETPGAAADWGIPVLYIRPVEGLRLELASPRLRVPTPIRFLRWGIAAFLSLLGIISLLLTIPDINQRLRTEVPVIKCLFPYPMESGFNVVVNELTVVDDKGSAIASSDGLAIADYLYQQLDLNSKDLILGTPYHLRRPEYTCPINGATRAEREKNAAALAEKINADVIVYGVVTNTVGLGSFSPEFYVYYKGFQDGSEVTGEYGLGKTLGVPLPFSDKEFTPADNPALSARTTALSLMTIGLAYYSIDHFDEASQYFEHARDTEGWADDAGKEIIYLLLGNTNNRRASREHKSAYLADSLTNFDLALDIRPTYARAMIGKAGVLYLLALGDPNNGDFTSIDLGQLDQSATLYQAARNLKNSPQSANVEAKVNFGLGQIDRVRFLHALAINGDSETPLAQAETEYQAVISEFNNGNDQIANLAGHSYASLGSIAFVQKKFDEAADLYAKSIPLVTPYYQSYYNSRLGEVYAGSCKLTLALDKYQTAIDIADFYGFEEAATYKKRLEEIRTSSCQPANNSS
jgi:tetratricopeptide (TPR) repeat protein/CHAT domain-containing protein